MRHRKRLYCCALLLSSLALSGCDRDAIAPERAVRAPDGPQFVINAPIAQMDLGGWWNGSSRYWHGCAVDAEGVVSCWGSNYDGQATVPTGLDAVAQVAAGGRHSCALRMNGTVTCWGFNNSGQVSGASGVTNATQVDAGGDHTCARKSDGRVMCWGNNTTNQVSGAFSQTNVMQIAAGDWHTCALKSGGTISCWGHDGYRQVSGPSGQTNVTQIAAGDWHTCALKSDGTIACWGHDAYRQVTGPAGITGVAEVVTGDYHTCARFTDGKVTCWGYDAYRQVSGPYSATGVVRIAAGESSTCVENAAGLQCWGESSTAGGVLTGSYRDVAPGGLHVCGFTTADTVDCVGRNLEGQTSVPGGLGALSNVVAGLYHTCTLDGGAVTCWGSNAFNQVTAKPTGNGFAQLAAGYYHTCALKASDGSVLCWGRGTEGQLNVPAALGPFTQVAAGLFHTCAIRTNQFVTCWGAAPFDQANVPGTLGPVLALAAGSQHTCALRKDGAIQCWGNPDARTAAPAGVYKQVSVGDLHSCGLLTSGAVKCWGHNTNSATTVPGTLGTVVVLRSKVSQTCTVDTVGLVECWGQPASTTYSLDADTDGDGIVDGADPDDDNDGVPDAHDNAPFVPNPDQIDTDGDSIGDVADPDDDNDGVADADDEAPLVPTGHADTDRDGVGDVFDADDDNDGVLDADDNAPLLPNPDQLDTDADGLGDVVDLDDDNDGVADVQDNCPLDSNTGQADGDADGSGDACDPSTPPTANAGGPYRGTEGAPVSFSGIGSDPDAGTTLTYAWDFDGDGQTDRTTANASHTYADNGTYTATLRVSDGEFSTESTASVTIDNAVPSAAGISHNGPVNEGSPITFSLANVMDPSPRDAAAGFQYAFDCGSGFGAFGPTNSVTCATTDDGTRVVKAKARDKDGGVSAEYSATISVSNVTPTLSAITAPIAPQPRGVPVSTSAAYTGATTDTHTFIINWGDGTSSTGTAASGTVSGSHEYLPGVYTIEMSVRDDDGSTSTSVFEYVVVYDPNGGFVTGGGWIESPAGAYVANRALAGKATFGFVSKYLKGATTPTGNTEFQFSAGDLHFRSTSYEWLVVNQAGTNAQFKGTGSINGAGSYRFTLWATDGTPDKFRIRIWQEDTQGNETAVYDNDVDQAVGGGSIVVHTKK